MIFCGRPARSRTGLEQGPADLRRTLRPADLDKLAEYVFKAASAFALSYCGLLAKEPLPQRLLDFKAVIRISKHRQQFPLYDFFHNLGKFLTG